MAAGRLILIEGMIGAGKSTTAAKLAAWLTSQGEDARAYHEFADDHPIRTRDVDLLRAAAQRDAGAAGVASDPAVYGLDQWARLARRCAGSGQTVILESTCLQNSVLPYFTGGAPIDEVKAVFATIDDHIAPADPTLIYLRPSDLDEAVTRVHRERGEAWTAQNVAWVANYPWARRRGLTGRQVVIELYRAWEGIVDELLAAASCATLLLTDPHLDWDATLNRIYAAVRR